jgi:hypothetical protein
MEAIHKAEVHQSMPTFIFDLTLATLKHGFRAYDIFLFAYDGNLLCPDGAEGS